MKIAVIWYQQIVFLGWKSEQQLLVANIGNHLGAARATENPSNDTGYVLELAIANMQISFLVIFWIFTSVFVFLPSGVIQAAVVTDIYPWLLWRCFPSKCWRIVVAHWTPEKKTENAREQYGPETITHVVKFLTILATSEKDFSSCRASCVIKPHSFLIDPAFQPPVMLADMSEMSGHFSVLESPTLNPYFSLQGNCLCPGLRWYHICINNPNFKITQYVIWISAKSIRCLWLD